MPGFIPILRVKDARKSERFYCDLLGFTKDWEHQFEANFPLMMSITAPWGTLMLSEHRETGTDNADIYLHVEDVDAIHAAAKVKGLAFPSPPCDQPWGKREIEFNDLDGHHFTFGQSIAT